jgi:hypothetical protein
VLQAFDDVRDLLEARWERLGYDRLLAEERDYLLVWWLQAEASNGTLHQYFSNSTGDQAEEALAALKRMGANNAHRILSKAVAAFGQAGYCSDRAERNRRLELIPDQYEVFQQITNELFDDSEDVASLAIDRVGSAYEERGIAADEPENAPRIFKIVAVVLATVLVLAGVVAVAMAVFA